jgi:DNA-binding response OmpR family regulator
MAAARVLVVHVEQSTAGVVADYLRRDGRDVLIVSDPEEGLEAYRQFQPDLIVVDGLEARRRLRALSDRPIIALVESRELEPLPASGPTTAEGYLTKPVTARELAAHARAALLRAQVEGEVLRFGDVTIDGRTRSAITSSGLIPLTAKEFELVQLLASNPGEVFSRQELIAAAWDQRGAPSPDAVTVHISRIRAKIEADPSRPRHIKTVWGVGYRLER